MSQYIPNFAEYDFEFAHKLNRAEPQGAPAVVVFSPAPRARVVPLPDVARCDLPYSQVVAILRAKIDTLCRRAQRANRLGRECLADAKRAAAAERWFEAHRQINEAGRLFDQEKEFGHSPAARKTAGELERALAILDRLDEWRVAEECVRGCGAPGAVAAERGTA